MLNDQINQIFVKTWVAMRTIPLCQQAAMLYCHCVELTVPQHFTQPNTRNDQSLLHSFCLKCINAAMNRAVSSDVTRYASLRLKATSIVSALHAFGANQGNCSLQGGRNMEFFLLWLVFGCSNQGGKDTGKSFYRILAILKHLDKNQVLNKRRDKWLL